MLINLSSGLSLITAGVACSAIVQGKQKGREMIQKNSIENESKTNVILIMTDALGVECLSCYGRLSYDTPNLDQMAEQGKLFTNCYSNLCLLLPG